MGSTLGNGPTSRFTGSLTLPVNFTLEPDDGKEIRSRIMPGNYRHCVCSANTNCWCKTGNLCKVNTGFGLNNHILFIFTVNIILETFLKMSLFEYRKAKKKVPENSRFSILLKVEIRIKTKNGIEDIINKIMEKQVEAKTCRTSRCSERVRKAGYVADLCVRPIGMR